MYVTITVETEGKRHTISIDERQYVSAVYEILKERGLVDGKTTPGLYKSALLEEWVRTEKTFKEQDISSGDILTAGPA